MSEPLDLVGKKFYRWTVLKRVENDSTASGYAAFRG